MASERVAYAAIYIDSSGEYRWRLHAANHELIASGESHAERSDAVRSLRTMQRVVEGGFFTVRVETRRDVKRGRA